MANLYLFAIGGSGSRTLRSLTMLLASGIESQYNIVPIIIDPDESNGDMERTVNLLRLYEDIHKSLIFDKTLKNKFFSANVTSLNNNGSYLLPLVGTSNINFDVYLGIDSMSQENQAFTKMLFSNQNLSSNMNVGFRGNPNIGSVVLNQFTQSDYYSTFETNFVEGDKVFIISSIFGGTGASGFPLILKKMRSSTNTALANAPIGAVSLLPYFNLKTNEDSTIKADSFITKTKAALNYYERNVTGNNSLNDMYYLGDDFSSYSYENCDGGDKQINEAHIIELLAALSIIDFEKKKNVAGGVTTFHEFGLEKSPKPNEAIVFSDFGKNTKRIIQRPLTMMSILNSYLNNRDKDHRLSQQWAMERDNLLGDSFFEGDFFNNFHNFKEDFEEWQSELAKNKIGFKPFKNDEDIKNIDGLIKVVGIKPKYAGLPGPWRKKGYDLIDQSLSENLKNVSHNLSAPVTFMELVYNTLLKICSKNLKIQ